MDKKVKIILLVAGGGLLLFLLMRRKTVVNPETGEVVQQKSILDKLSHFAVDEIGGLVGVGMDAWERGREQKMEEVGQYDEQWHNVWDDFNTPHDILNKTDLY